MLKGGVGTGKSRTALAYFFSTVCGGKFPINGVGSFQPMSSARDLYIITPAKKRDSGEWLTEAIEFQLTSIRENSFGFVPVTVDSWNNISNYVEVKDAFFIFDEQRLVGSGAWVKAFYKIARNNQWIILSATPGDTWTDYIPAFVANGFYRNRTEFIERHAVFSRYSKYPKIDRFVDTGRLLGYRKRLLVEMPYRRATKRHKQQLVAEYDSEQLASIIEKRWNPWDEVPIENISQLFYLMRKSVNSNASRVQHLYEVWEKHKRIIVFYNFLYELDLMRTFLSQKEIRYSEWNGQKHQEIPDTDSWIYLVQYTSGAEAWNCISTNAIFFYSLNYSWRITEQCEGRIDRMNTPYTDLYYYFCRSTSSIDQAIMKALNTKKKFNEQQTALEWNVPLLTELPKVA